MWVGFVKLFCEDANAIPGTVLLCAFYAPRTRPSVGGLQDRKVGVRLRELPPIPSLVPVISLASVNNRYDLSYSSPFLRFPSPPSFSPFLVFPSFSTTPFSTTTRCISAYIGFRLDIPQ